MWTLGVARDRLSDRLSEESSVFWSPDDRDNYINDAQTFIASITRGCPQEIGPTSVSSATPYISLPFRAFSAHAAQGWTEDGDVLTVVPIYMANQVERGWRQHVASRPLWLITDFSERRAYVSPIPSPAKNVYVKVAVYPDVLETDSTPLFNGIGSMEKYQSPLLNLAASYALLKERYDQDAERFYGVFAQEMQSLGFAPEEIQSFDSIRAERAPE
jgi:hypothetical protein